MAAMVHAWALLLFSSLLMSSLPSSWAQQMSVRQVAVVHRHGARTPVPSVNQSALCPGGASQCGVLTLQGKTMLTNLGSHLRETYGETMQPSEFYDPDIFHSQSTDVDRTIQSADALLSGLFLPLEDTDQRVYPVVNTVEIERDTELLVWDGWPALVLWSASTSVPFFHAVNQAVLGIIPAAALQAVGEEIGLADECSPASPGYFPFQCAIDAEDFFSYSVTIGTTGSLPLTAHYYPQLIQCLETYNQFAMGRFDEETNGGKFIEAVGTFGYPLMVDILTQLNTPAWNPASPNSGGRRLSHYSGHDVTLIPLTNTLGNTTMLNPVFGAALIFELWSATVNTSDAFVAAKFGQPEQDPASNYTYQFENFTLTCLSSSGTLYQSSAGCPLPDLNRYIATRGPGNAMGTCFTSNETRAFFNCTHSDPAPPQTYCAYYRSMCLDACGATGAMFANLSCVEHDGGAVSTSRDGNVHSLRYLRNDRRTSRRRRFGPQHVTL